jgi:hypothetical protein
MNVICLDLTGNTTRVEKCFKILKHELVLRRWWYRLPNTRTEMVNVREVSGRKKSNSVWHGSCMAYRRRILNAKTDVLFSVHKSSIWSGGHQCLLLCRGVVVSLRTFCWLYSELYRWRLLAGDSDRRLSKYLQRIVWTSIPFPNMFAFNHQRKYNRDTT